MIQERICVGVDFSKTTTQVKGKYDANVFMMFAQLFEVLPIATVVQKKVFVVHGGLFRRDSVYPEP